MSTEAVVAISAVMLLCYVAAGVLVAARVAARSGVDARAFRIVVIALWPFVAIGVEILWLLGVNDWRLR